MSAPPTIAAWRASIIASDLGPTDRLVAFILIQHFERNRNGGWCAVSVGTLSRETGLSRPPVVFALGRLVKAGFVEREHDGRGKRAFYRISSKRGLLLSEGDS